MATSKLFGKHDIKLEQSGLQWTSVLFRGGGGGGGLGSTIAKCHFTRRPRCKS